jgi:hypothetical protein
MNTNLGRNMGEIVAYRIDGALAIYDYTNEDEFDIGHIVMSDGRKAQQAPLLSILAHGYWSDDLSAVMNPFTVRKHQAGKHDQKLHGTWANQMELEGLESPLSGEYGAWGDRAAELEAARSIGPDADDLRNAISPDLDSVSDEEIRETVMNMHDWEIELEVEERLRNTLLLDGDKGGEVRRLYTEEILDDYVARLGDGYRVGIANRNVPTIDVDTMNEVYGINHQGVNRNGRDVSLTSIVEGVSSYGDEIFVTGVIMNNNSGMNVGGFERRFTLDAYGNVTVTHELLQLNQGAQGSGFATAFNRQAENYYITHGIDTIYVHAGLDTGGYTWASAGFDWDFRDHASSINNVVGKIDDYLGDNQNIPSGLLSELESLKTRLQSPSVTDPDYPTPKEIADLGRISGVDTWPGKEIMTGSNWYGNKFLRPEGARVSETQANNNAARRAREASEQQARVAAESAPMPGQLTMDTGFLEGSLAQDPNFQPGLFPPIPGMVESN